MRCATSCASSRGGKNGRGGGLLVCQAKGGLVSEVKKLNTEGFGGGDGYKEESGAILYERSDERVRGNPFSTFQGSQEREELLGMKRKRPKRGDVGGVLTVLRQGVRKNKDFFRGKTISTFKADLCVGGSQNEEGRDWPSAQDKLIRMQLEKKKKPSTETKA